MLLRTRRDFVRALSGCAAAAATPGAIRATEAQRAVRAYPFTLGVASGYPTPDGVVLWTRLAPSPLEPLGGLPPATLPVRWEIASDADMQRIVARGTEYATPEWGFSVRAEPHGLEMDRDYWYRFTAAGERSPIGRTRTAPAADASPSHLRIALASCQQYERGYFAAYRHMLGDELDLVVHVGDYIYEYALPEGARRVRGDSDPETYSLEDYRRRYALYRTDPDLAAAHAACPWLVTWDDHEVDNDYAGSFSEWSDAPETFLARRAAAYRAFYEHMPLPRAAAPRGAHMRLYAHRAFGTLANIYMLDGRQYRSPHACPREGRRGANRVSDCAQLDDAARSLLGYRQEKWLAKRAGASRARWNLLAQGVVMSHIDEDPGEGRRYWTDSWNGYPPARERLLSMLAHRRVSNPVVLSGDIHTFIAGTLHEQPRDPESRAVACELVCTSISSPGIPQERVDAIRAINPAIAYANTEHRGYVRLEITPERLRADLMGLDDVTQRASGARTLRSFVVEPGRSALSDA